MLADGLSDLPAGKLAALVTYLVCDLAAENAEASGAMPANAALDRFTRLDGRCITRYRTLFRAVGTDWLWFSRLRMPDDELEAILDQPEVFALALHDDRAQGGPADIGLLELDFSDGATGYLSFLGLVPGATGQGIGRIMMDVAKALARSHAVHTLFVNTCTLDHPAALDFYRKNGFVATRQALEVFDDPRLTGLLPRDAAPRIPLALG